MAVLDIVNMNSFIMSVNSQVTMRSITISVRFAIRHSRYTNSISHSLTSRDWLVQGSLGQSIILADSCTVTVRLPCGPMVAQTASTHSRLVRFNAGRWHVGQPGQDGHAIRHFAVALEVLTSDDQKHHGRQHTSCMWRKVHH